MICPNGFIAPHGGFRSLKSFQMSEIVYNGTVRFCDRWVGRRSRTHDQMVQAARSDKQNIAKEGGFTERLYHARISARKR
jgi:hypothetical protein